MTFQPCVLASRSWERTSACYQQLIRDCSRDADAVSVLRAHLRRYLVYSRPCLDRSQRSECIVGRNVRWPRSRLVLRAPPSHAEHTPRMTPDNAGERRDRQTDGPTDRRQTVALWYSLFTMNCSTQQYSTHTHTHTHTSLMAFFSGTTRVSRYQKVKPIWILLEQETVSGSGISWVICKSAPRSRQITTPTPTTQVFYRPDALPAAQPQRQSTEGTQQYKVKKKRNKLN